MIESERCAMNDRIELLESALKVIRVWAKNNELNHKKVLHLCDSVLPRFIHELPNVRRKRLVDLGG
jgi:hypothetical protein